MWSLDASIALFVYSFRVIILWHVWLWRLIMYLPLMFELLLDIDVLLGRM